MSAEILLFTAQGMSDAYVNDARRWAGVLLAREHRGPGDTIDAAMWRTAEKLGIAHGTFWALRYRAPKDILVGVYMRLKAAYEHEVTRQEAKLAHELMLAKMVGLDEITSSTVAEVEDFLRGKKGAPVR